MYTSDLTKHDKMAVEKFIKQHWNLINEVYPHIVVNFHPPLTTEQSIDLFSQVQKDVIIRISQEPMFRDHGSEYFYKLPLPNRMALIEKRMEFDSKAKQLDVFLNSDTDKDPASG